MEIELLVQAPTDEEKAAQEQKDRLAVEEVAEAARSFLRAYDEFWPEYPYAIGEDMDALIRAIDLLGD